MRMFSIFFSITFFFLLISKSNAHTHGVATIDSVIFDKILNKFDVILVKFDDKFPFGEKQEQFKKFAETAANTKGLLVAEVPVTDIGERENEDLARKYNAKKEDFPVYKLFLKNKYQPIDYTGDKTEVDLKRFLTQYTSLWFGLPGTLEELDYLARDFFDAASSKDEKGLNTLLTKAQSEVNKLADKKDQKTGQSYLKIMDAVAKQGIEFLKREGRRIENLLKGPVSNEKKEELQHRANIIASFKSAKDSVMYKIDEKSFNSGQQVKPPGVKDL